MARCKYCKIFVFRHVKGIFTRLQNTIKPDPAQAQGSSSPVGWVYKHHKSLNNLQRSAEAGCQLCRLLLGGLCEPISVERIPPSILPEKEDEVVTIYCFSVRERILSESGLLARCGNDRFVRFGIKGVIEDEGEQKDEDEDEDDDRNGDTVDDSTGSTKNLQLASQWLQRCEDYHKDCYAGQDMLTTLPTRVLNVGAQNGVGNPRLEEPWSSTYGYYVTLSHRWGPGSPITTTTETLSERKRSIPLSSLPKTFQEAVDITRKLKIQYLWIDSLCILQDSKEDWEKEAARMGEYYRKARFNIAAEDAADCTEGCYRKRDPASVRHCRVKVQLSNMRSLRTSFWVFPLIEEPTDWRSSVQSYLDPRGWIFQERLFARRTLFFSRFQLSFRCMVEEASEIHPRGIYRDEVYFEERKKRGLSHSGIVQTLLLQPYVAPATRIYSPLQPPDTPSSPNWEARIDSDGTRHPQNARDFKPYAEWHSVVETYATCDFTVPYDILPALSSLASIFSRNRYDSYTAGIWGLDFRRSLLWRVEDPPTHNAYRLDPPRAPSWSWASIVCKKLTFTCPNIIAWDDRRVCIIEDVPNQRLENQNRLQVRGYLITAAVREKPANLTHNRFDGETAAAHRLISSRPLDALGPRISGALGYFHPDTSDVWGSNICCLPLCTVPLGARSGLSHLIQVRMLGLKPTEDDDGATFTRVGEGMLFLPVGWANLFEMRSLAIY